ncbi:hypothetical protein [Staphylococcus equorum]|uniref:hypothetical protein n=1 Tax=Staphylococcus equorum TaxID=246432 RepID=UPI000E678655|nr:hypothetical protein [Staphylococcus equorum]RIL36621.1 hypothetical protein BUY84_13005 [Staphylococcus equorum]
MTNSSLPNFLEITSTLTTTFTAVFSVIIAYKSHKTTIEQKKLDKKETSSKIIRQFERKTLFLRGQILILTLGGEKYSKEIGLSDPINIPESLKNEDIRKDLDKYIEKAGNLLDKELKVLTVEDEKKIIKTIDKAKWIKTRLNLLEKEAEILKKEEQLTSKDIRTDERIIKQQNSIADKAKELLNEI